MQPGRAGLPGRHRVDRRGGPAGLAVHRAGAGDVACPATPGVEPRAGDRLPGDRPGRRSGGRSARAALARRAVRTAVRAAGGPPRPADPPRGLWPRTVARNRRPRLRGGRRRIHLRALGTQHGGPTARAGRGTRADPRYLHDGAGSHLPAGRGRPGLDRRHPRHPGGDRRGAAILFVVLAVLMLVRPALFAALGDPASSSGPTAVDPTGALAAGGSG